MAVVAQAALLHLLIHLRLNMVEGQGAVTRTYRLILLAVLPYGVGAVAVTVAGLLPHPD